jgi:hypothetical protein
MVVLAACVAAVGGAVTGKQLGASGGASLAASVQLHAGAAHVTLPSGWSESSRGIGIPGLNGSATATDGLVAAAIAFLPAADASLLPPAVVSAADGRRTLELPAGRAWEYRIPVWDGGSTSIVIVAPTTAGVLTVGCSTDPAIASVIAASCRSVAAGVRLTSGVRWWSPALETAMEIRLPGVLERLNATRRRGRARLAGTTVAAARGAAARGLAHAYRRAAADVSPFAAGRAARIPTQFRRLSDAHRSLARAAILRMPRRERAADAAVRRGESRLAAELARVRA